MNQPRKNQLKNVNLALTLLLGLQCSAFQPATAQAGDFKADSGFAVSNRDADNYLRTMKRITHDFNETVTSLVLPSSGGLADSDSMQRAVERTQKLSNEINSVKPPPEMKAAHSQLGQTMASVENYLSLGGLSAQGTAKALNLAGEVQSTMSTYHNAVSQMISRRGLDPAQDPFAGESSAMKMQALQQINSLTQAASGATSPSTRPGTTSGGIGDLGGALDQGLGGMTGGDAQGNPLGALGGMLGGSGGANPLGGLPGGGGNANPLGGMDMGTLMHAMQALMGSMGGGAAGGAMGGLGGSAGGMGGLGGGSDEVPGAGTTSGGADLNSLMQSLMGGSGLNGGAAPASTTPEPVGPPDPTMGGMPGPPIDNSGK